MADVWLLLESLLEKTNCLDIILKIRLIDLEKRTPIWVL